MKLRVAKAVAINLALTDSPATEGWPREMHATRSDTFTKWNIDTAFQTHQVDQ